MAQRHEDQGEDAAWHLDKKVPVALILAIVIQTATAIWWASGVDQRLAGLEVAAPDNRKAWEKLAVVESQVTGMRADLTELRQLLLSYMQKNSRGQ
ncbi:hypothetical protein [Dongia mobilis]|uniref:hypothetical protein n=1 Tax=Dongia sp. TaxID=1977262 RepID=UPI0026EDBE5E